MVKIERQLISIDTYGVYPADKSPIFFEKRPYQGADGKIYPIPYANRLTMKKQVQEYDAVTIENEYVKLLCLPELGGRIQYGIDKTNEYAFFYNNRVIKPALIGLAGPWISGGVEFNWPQHHRPTTYLPTECRTETNADGSSTCYMGETEPLYGLRSEIGVTLYPGSSGVIVKVRLSNPTDIPQPMMWWANLAVACNKDYRVFFPPDVKQLAQHDRSFLYTYPICEGKLVGRPDEESVDISWYKNIAGSVSTMVMDGSSEYNFVAGYDTGKKAGTVHVAPRYLSPAKKMFTWGNSSHADAWRDNLTDEDGHYLELMSGFYTDNQPDFSWIMPHEVREFEHIWYPLRDMEFVKNATAEAAIGLDKCEGGMRICVNTTAARKGMRIIVKRGEDIILDGISDISPDKPFSLVLSELLDAPEDELAVRVFDGATELVSYTPAETLKSLTTPFGTHPDEQFARKPSSNPTEIASTDELFMYALHIYQYRSPSLSPLPYFEEIIKRDAEDARANHWLGVLALERGDFAQAEKYFVKSLKRQTTRNTNPYYGDTLYMLGVSRNALGDSDGALKSFYKATWNYGTQSAAWYQVAALESRAGNISNAIAAIEKSIHNSASNSRAIALKSALLQSVGKSGEASALLKSVAGCGTIDPAVVVEMLIAGNTDESALRIFKGKPEYFCGIALDYINAGLYGCAVRTVELALCIGCEYPMLYYTAGYAEFLGNKKNAAEAAAKWFKQGENACPDYCFPNRNAYLAVLKNTVELLGEAPMALYYSGNIKYNRDRWEEAAADWNAALKLKSDYAMIPRNLAFAQFNHLNDAQSALANMQKAYAADPCDGRILYELSQIYKVMGKDANERMALLKANMKEVTERNELYIEMLLLHMQNEEYAKVWELSLNHEFYTYEGGEGQLPVIYEYSHIIPALEKAKSGDIHDALDILSEGGKLPANFHEGRRGESMPAHIKYFTAAIESMRGNENTAAKTWNELSEIDSGMGMGDEIAFYRGLSLKRLGRNSEAKKIFDGLIERGDKLLNRSSAGERIVLGMRNTAPFEGNNPQSMAAAGEYWRALGYFGLGGNDNEEKSSSCFTASIAANPNSMKTYMLQRIIERFADILL